MKPDVLQRVVKHGTDLNRLFCSSKHDPVTLCRKVRRLEAEAHQAATDYCNGEITSEAMDRIEQSVLDRLNMFLKFRERNIPVFINLDARGYALKIRSEYCQDKSIYKDWGGYGIIAPDLS